MTISAAAMLDQIEACGYTDIIWLPDSESAAMYDAILARPAIRLVPVAREGEAIPIAAGLIVTGRRPVVQVQNTGYFETGDSIRGLAIDLALPLVMIIGYRGWKPDGTATDSAALYLEPTLAAWSIPHSLVTRDGELGRIAEAQRAAEARPGPVAVLVAGEYV